MKVYGIIWKYMEVYKVYPDILKKSSGRKEGKGREGMVYGDASLGAYSYSLGAYSMGAYSLTRRILELWAT